MACSKASLDDENPFHSDPFQPVYFPRFPKCYRMNIKSTIQNTFGGTIQHIRKYPNPNSSLGMCVFVTFVSPAVAKRAVFYNFKWPNGEMVSIEKADDWDEPTENISESFTEEASHFNVLNTDCLIHLYKYIVDPMDIANISEAIPSLHKFAVQYIYDKYTKLELCLKSDCNNEITFQDLKRVLKYFGTHTTHCTLDAHRFLNPTVAHIRAVLRYCPNLVHIRLEFFVIVTSFPKILGKEHLQPSEVQFIDCDIMDSDWAPLWTKWTNLRALTIHGSKTHNSDILEPLRNLETLSLSDDWIGSKALLNVCSRNAPTLTSLTIVRMYRKQYDTFFLMAPNKVHVKLNFRCSDDGRLAKTRQGPSGWKLEQELDLILRDFNMIEAAAALPVLRGMSIRFPGSRDQILDTYLRLPKPQLLELTKFLKRVVLKDWTEPEN